MAQVLESWVHAPCACGPMQQRPSWAEGTGSAARRHAGKRRAVAALPTHHGQGLEDPELRAPSVLMPQAAEIALLRSSTPATYLPMATDHSLTAAQDAKIAAHIRLVEGALAELQRLGAPVQPRPAERW